MAFLLMGQLMTSGFIIEPLQQAKHSYYISCRDKNFLLHFQIRSCNSFNSATAKRIKLLSTKKMRLEISPAFFIFYQIQPDSSIVIECYTGPVNNPPSDLSITIILKFFL